MCYCRHFRVTVIVDGSIGMVMMMMVMVMRNRVRCIAGHAYWRTILPLLTVMVMAGYVSMSSA